MKKILLAFFVIFSSIFTNTSFVSAWFLDWGDDLNLFKKIDEGVYKLQSQMFDVAVKWYDPKWDIWKQLNANLVEKCFKEDWSIKLSDLQKIRWTLNSSSYSWWTNEWEWNNLNDFSTSIDTADKRNQLENLVKILEDKCFSKWIAVEKIVLYIDTINKHLDEKYKIAWRNAGEIYSISRIGLYSDWVEENSPFDLMKDLKDINKIIFTEDIPYEWVNTMNNDSALSAYLAWKTGKDIINAAKNPSNSANSNNWNWTKDSDNSGINPIMWDNNDSNYACITNESGLSDKQLNSILPNTWGTWSKLDKIQKVWVNSKFDPNSGWSFSGNINIKWNWYSPLNDNGLWPCNEFFCITIDFKIYTQNLLWWGKTNSIQALIERSNGHLKKFTNSSLIQSRQTTNNFQMGLKDLSLPDLFNVNFVIDHKAPPILNLNWWKELANTPARNNKHKDLLNEYFKNYWLDYERINDLEKFNRQECEIASVINSAELNISQAPLNNTACANMEYNAKLNEVISWNIDSNIVSGDLKDFDNQFVELSWFLANFPRYASEINIIVSKMLYKPKWSK